MKKTPFEQYNYPKDVADTFMLPEEMTAKMLLDQVLVHNDPSESLDKCDGSFVVNRRMDKFAKETGLYSRDSTELNAGFASDEEVSAGDEGGGSNDGIDAPVIRPELDNHSMMGEAWNNFTMNHGDGPTVMMDEIEPLDFGLPGTKDAVARTTSANSKFTASTGELVSTARFEDSSVAVTARMDAAVDGGMDMEAPQYSRGTVFIPPGEACYPVWLTKQDKGGVRVTSPYGMRKGKFHSGVDLGRSLSSFPSSTVSANDILATWDGEVTDSSWHSGYGLMVTIEHSEKKRGQIVTTRYAHLYKSYVGPGTRVKAGRPIGKMGNTGHSFGVHLHLEVLVGGVRQDPATYLKDAYIRRG